MVNNHPNATAAAGGGSASIVLVWALGYLGLDISAEIGAAIATAIASATLIVGRSGVSGLLHVIWKGDSNGQKPKS